MDTTTDTIAERVRRGALLLDKHAPGWAWQINEWELDLGSCDKCILGQIYGYYEFGFFELISHEPDSRLFSASGHGFTLPESDQDEAVEADEIIDARFSALAAAWLLEIRARLAPEPDEAIGVRNCPEHAALVP